MTSTRLRPCRRSTPPAMRAAPASGTRRSTSGRTLSPFDWTSMDSAVFNPLKPPSGWPTLWVRSRRFFSPIPESLVLRPIVPCILLAACLAGCVQKQARINHVVLIELTDESDSNTLLADCKRLLLPIPAVKTYWAGMPLDIGRGAAIDGNYTVGLCVGFDTVEGYKAYLEHPSHLELVATWKPKWQGARLFDIDANLTVVD